MAKETYKDGPYEGLPINNESKTWLVDYFMKRAYDLDKKSRIQDKYIERFAEELDGKDSQEWYEALDEELESKRYPRPMLSIADRDRPRLEKSLDNFLKANYQRKPLHVKKKDAQYLIYWLIKNLTNSDCEDLISYVDRFTDFTLDTTFDNLNNVALLGTIDDKNFYTMNVEEYESGLETQNLLLFWAENASNSVVLPFIRYGIENTPKGKTAYVYAMQKRALEKTDLEKELDRIFAGANSGVKENRNATPSMLCVLSAFAGLLDAKGIKSLKVPDFIVRRYGKFWGSTNEETDNRIQNAATNKFIAHFLRLDQQFNGIDVYAYPNDIDSYLHLSLDENISSSNLVLQKFFDMGKSIGNIQTSNIDINKLPNALTPPETPTM